MEVSTVKQHDHVRKLEDIGFLGKTYVGDPDNPKSKRLVVTEWELDFTSDDINPKLIEFLNQFNPRQVLRNSEGDFTLTSKDSFDDE